MANQIAYRIMVLPPFCSAQSVKKRTIVTFCIAFGEQLDFWNKIRDFLTWGQWKTKNELVSTVFWRPLQERQIFDTYANIYAKTIYGIHGPNFEFISNVTTINACKNLIIYRLCKRIIYVKKTFRLHFRFFYVFIVFMLQ